jgi:membrane-bound serine protease (ClpP class)
MAVQARRRPVVTGSEELIGAPGQIMHEADGQWWARVHGEIWKVHSRFDLHQGQRVRVTRIDGLMLEVRPDTHTT